MFQINALNSIKPKYYKVSPNDILERVKLFTEAMNLGEYKKIHIYRKPVLLTSIKIPPLRLDTSYTDSNIQFNHVDQLSDINLPSDIFKDLKNSNRSIIETLYFTSNKQQELRPEQIETIKGFPLAYNISLDYKDDDIIEVALFKAAMKHDQEKFSSLIEHKDLNPSMKTHVLSYGMQIACGFRDRETIEFLLKNGVDVANLLIIDDKNGFEIIISPIHGVLSGWCISSSADQEIIKLLLDSGANVNLEDNFGSTPLTKAIYLNKSEIVKLLLDAGANVNLNDDFEYTPLIAAIYKNNSEIVKLLLDANADVNLISVCGNSPLTKAIFENHLESIKLLLDAGADVNLMDNFGSTPLTEAISKNHSEIVKLLVDAGVNVNLIPKNDFNSWFFHKNNYECAKIIVASGKLNLADIKQVDIAAYNQMKLKVQFEQKALTDIEAIKNAGLECNSFKNSFISKKTIDSMLKYYQGGYKSTIKEEDNFINELAGKVVNELEIYTQYNWPQILGIAKTLTINSSDDPGESTLTTPIELPMEIIGQIGEHVWHDVLDSANV